MGPADKLAAQRDSTVVCLCVGPGKDSSGVIGVLAHTPPDVPLIVLSSDKRSLPADAGVGELELLAIDGGGRTLAGLVGQVVSIAGEADLVLLNGSCRVPSGWLGRLRAAACSDDSVASATPLSGGGGTAGVPSRHGDADDRLVEAVATRSRPRMLIGGPECIYLRRSALELIGGVAGDHDSLAELIADLCEQFIGAGMVNVLADDLYLDCPRDSDGRGDRLGGALGELDRSDERSALQRSLQLSRSTLDGLSVTIDARSLGPTLGGTQRYTLELVLGLARFTDATVRAVVAPELGSEAASALSGDRRIEVITYEQAVAGVELTDVVHRPQQVFSEGDINLLRLLGRRVVVTHQDLIGYHNPSYHETLETWKQFRRITRIALAAADRVVFFSQHSRRDAEAEDLVSSERSDVVGAAIAPADSSERVAPTGALQGQAFLLCLGADYRHKNRPFAIELVRALRSEQAWPGILVLAGSHVPYGSSRAREAELLRGEPVLSQAIVDLGSVTDQGLAWLLEHASAILAPSIAEGFGLVPLEAARVGRPCLFAPISSVTEVLDESLATLVPWNASRSASAVVPLLRDDLRRREHVERLRAAAGRWSWERIAKDLVGTYQLALRSPYRAAAARAWQELERERYLAEVDRSRQEMRTIHEELLTHLGGRVALASDEGYLTANEQQGLLRVGARPALARTVLWPLAMIGSLRKPGATKRPGSG
jgi:glycosyltransferase involved in cell wall biosynthesis